MENSTPKIEFIISPLETDILRIYSGLAAFNASYFPELNERTIGFFVVDQTGIVIGGIVAKSLYTSFHINYFWLPESIRGLGVGRELMQYVVREAEVQGVKNIYLDTYSFQAEGFYKKFGFKEVGRFSNYPKEGVDKIFLQKNLFDS